MGAELIANRKDRIVNRISKMQKQASIEREMDNYFSSPQGLMKLASDLSNPVRRQLDYVGITRNFSVVETLPLGMPAVFDRDMAHMGAVAVSNARLGGNGAVREIHVDVERVDLGEGFEIGIVPQVPYRQTYIRRYDVVKRMGERVLQGIQQREDLIWLSYLDTAATIYTGAERKHPYGNIPLTVTGKVSKGALSDAFAQIVDRRLPVRYVLGDAYLAASIRNWTFSEMDQAGMQELRETGYLGDMWGASFFFNDQLGAATVGTGTAAEANKGVCYILTEPEFLSWVPLRCDVQIQPADKTFEFTLGFAAYEQLAMVVHNSWGVVRLIYDKTAY